MYQIKKVSQIQKILFAFFLNSEKCLKLDNSKLGSTQQWIVDTEQLKRLGTELNRSGHQAVIIV